MTASNDGIQAQPPSNLETSSALAVNGAARLPLPCEPIGPAASTTTTQQAVSKQSQGSMGGGLANCAPQHGGAGLSLTPAIAAALIHAERHGVPASTAAAAAGISRHTLTAWRQGAERGTWPDGSPVSSASAASLALLAQGIAAARAECEAEQAELILKAAKVTGKSGIPEWRAAAWWLNNSPQTRQQWREHRELKVEHQGQVSHEHRLVRQLEEPQVLELAGPDFADLVG